MKRTFLSDINDLPEATVVLPSPMLIAPLPKRVVSVEIVHHIIAKKTLPSSTNALPMLVILRQLQRHKCLIVRKRKDDRGVRCSIG